MNRATDRLCTFDVRCPGAQHVYLVGDLARGRATTVSLRPVGDDDRWRAVLMLPPGTYRFRYYVDDGSRLTYFSTAERLDGWDAVLTVGER